MGAAYDLAKSLFKQDQDSRNARGLSSVYVQPTNASAYDKAKDWYNYQQTYRETKGAGSSTSYSSSSGSSTSYSSSSGSSTSSASTSPTTVTASSNVYNYTGGNRKISDYTEDRQIVFGANYSSVYVSNDSLNLNTDSGTLTISNMKNKIVDLRDRSGNVLAKAYMSGYEGTLDGRTLTGYEFIIGSTAGSNSIYAGDGGSTLWGNSGNIVDNLVGGAGVDTFFFGKNDGSDNITNASSSDRIDLYDVSMSDIVSASESGGTITLGFSGGNTLSVQGTDGLSAKFSLADGSNYRYNRETGSWQSA